MNKALLLIVTLVFSTAAAAQQYKWVDKDGKVRYGDVPPPGVNATRLKPPPSGSAPAPAASAAAKKDGAKALTPEEAFRQRQEAARKDADKQAKADQEKAESQANCARAQDVLRALQSGQRIARTDSKGERYYLEDGQVAQETAAARESVRQHCK
ncbi:MAG TPA: DUF4124 domain-containing protein [Burkholderiales bacterium]|nr:DUF4124 domain-containing protein [Burkholderiales bacterium]HVJ23421.1 DUF4124 domain-containing protein [Burkholderiales bacterium]